MAKGDLQNVGHVTLKTGEAANDGGDRYRVWDAVKANYAIGKSYPGSTPAVNADSFDRPDELLQK